MSDPFQVIRAKFNKKREWDFDNPAPHLPLYMPTNYVVQQEHIGRQPIKAYKRVGRQHWYCTEKGQWLVSYHKPENIMWTNDV